MWAAAFRGREDKREGEGWGEDGLLLNPLVGMFVVFGPVWPSLPHVPRSVCVWGLLFVKFCTF